MLALRVLNEQTAGEKLIQLLASERAGLSATARRCHANDSPPGSRRAPRTGAS